MAPPNEKQTTKRGCKVGATYNRRTKVQIDKDSKEAAAKKKEEAEKLLQRNRRERDTFRTWNPGGGCVPRVGLE
jgi:hypothetical protein